MVAGVISASIGLAGIISPQTFQCELNDESQCKYIPAKVTVMVTQAGAAVTFICLFLYYVFENRRRDRKAHVHGAGETVASDTVLTEEDSWGGLTDKENWEKFRYVY